MAPYVALYRKFRPLIFNDVVGQEQITKILKHQIQNNQIGHAYLFCGGRGTGKTSTAKIFSRAVNCLSPVDGEPCNECSVCKGILSSSVTDIMEIDAASNNGVDNIRSIKENVIYAPTVAKYKVYIIDEVHMLSGSAFNALLKTLEEPPENVIFILATTEPHKIPITILSRCQRFEFKRISKPNIVKRLSFICGENQIAFQENALSVIAQAADGALRDAISLLDKIISSGVTEITEHSVRTLLGIEESSTTSAMLQAILSSRLSDALSIISSVTDSGKDIKYFIWEIVNFARDVLIYQVTKDDSLINNYASLEAIQQMQNADSKKLERIISDLSELENQIKASSFPNILLESSVIRLMADLNAPVKTYPQAAPVASAPISQPSQPTPVPAERKAPPPPPPSSESWKEVIQHLKTTGKMSLYATLAGTTANVTDTGVTIYFKQAFGKNMIERSENMKTLRESILSICGKDLTVKCVVESTEEKSSLDELENTLLNSGIHVNID
ncbi:MAG: DNA polymerase III subunit gamma/tau [Clostridia bacterium]|nr:DNA polymerase III subunit gamma/tau [Clostridia bacterium]